MKTTRRPKPFQEQYKDCKHESVRWESFDSRGCIEAHHTTREEAVEDVRSRKSKGRQREEFMVVSRCRVCRKTMSKEAM